MDHFIDYFNTVGAVLIVNIVSAIFIVLIGLYLANLLTNLFVKTLGKTDIEKTLLSFLKSILNTALKFFVFFSAATKLGFSANSLVAIVGAVGAALALGFKDSLGSLVSGIIILFAKPFIIGDFIEVDGQSGNVKEIQMMTTTLVTVDRRFITIPNNIIANSTVINYSKSTTRRVDIDFEVDYETNIDLAKNLISKVVCNHPEILQDPEPFVRVTQYASSSIIITARVWCLNQNYWNVKFDLLEQVKKEFDANGISIPFTQIDVHMKGE